WHYSALAVDVDQGPASGDGTVSNNFRFVLENDGRFFRIWCLVDPQPEAPTDPADDLKDPYVQYRNRNVRTKSISPGKPVDAKAAVNAKPLFHQTSAS